MTDRSTYLGATDVAAVLGLSPYRAPIEVWHEKRGTGPPAEQTPRMRLGQLLEGAVADAYAEQTGRRLRRTGLIHHPAHPFLAGHPDRIVIGERGLLEVKTSASTAGYDNGDVPAHVRIQAVWYCGLTRREWCDVALLARQEVRIERVPADPDLYGLLVDAAVEWHATYIAGDAEPAPDGSAAYRAHLAAKYPADNGAELIATPEQELLARQLRDMRADLRAMTAREDEIKARLMAGMGESTYLRGAGFRLSWKAQSGRTDWRAVAADYRSLIETYADSIAASMAASGEALAAPDGDYSPAQWLDFIASMHTAEPSRVFRPHFTETE